MMDETHTMTDVKHKLCYVALDFLSYDIHLTPTPPLHPNSTQLNPTRPLMFVIGARHRTNLPARLPFACLVKHLNE
jgi:hypothetical protein